MLIHLIPIWRILLCSMETNMTFCEFIQLYQLWVHGTSKPVVWAGEHMSSSWKHVPSLWFTFIVLFPVRLWGRTVRTFCKHFANSVFCFLGRGWNLPSQHPVHGRRGAGAGRGLPGGADRQLRWCPRRQRWACRILCLFKGLVQQEIIFFNIYWPPILLGSWERLCSPQNTSGALQQDSAATLFQRILIWYFHKKS